MSTPEERLKKQAEELRKHPQETPAQQAAREQQENEKAQQRLRKVGQAYLKRVKALIDETQMRIHHYLNPVDPGMSRRFTLEVGRHPGLQARINGEGWEVTVYRGTGSGIHEYASDDAILGAMDELLEPLVSIALVALNNRTERAAPDGYGRS